MSFLLGIQSCQQIIFKNKIYDIYIEFTFKMRYIIKKTLFGVFDMGVELLEKPSTQIEFSLIQKPIIRGDIWLADLGLTCGSLQSGERPFLILSNDIGNKHSSIVWGVAITSKVKKKLPTHVEISSIVSGLKYDSIIQCEQPRSLHKWFLIDHITSLNKEIMNKVKSAFLISGGF